MSNHGYDTLYRHTCRVAGMMADPECIGDLLLVGVGLARAVDLDDPPFVNGKMPTSAIARRIYNNAHHPTNLHYWGRGEWPRADSRGPHRILDVLRADIRRYTPDDSYSRVVCGRPMPERDTGRCGRRPHSSHVRRFTDPVTGLREYVAACGYPAHRAWWTALRAQNVRDLAAMTVPYPPANRGGILAHHLDEIDWPGLYTHLDPKWCPPPEMAAWTPPTLRLVVDTDVPELPSPDLTRPVLTAIQGGWR